MDYALPHGNNTNGERFKCVCGLSAGNSGKSVVSKSKGSGQPVLFYCHKSNFHIRQSTFFVKKNGAVRISMQKPFFSPRSCMLIPRSGEKTVKKEKCNRFIFNFSIFLFVLR